MDSTVMEENQMDHEGTFFQILENDLYQMQYIPSCDGYRLISNLGPVKCEIVSQEEYEQFLSTGQTPYCILPINNDELGEPLENQTLKVSCLQTVDQSKKICDEGNLKYNCFVPNDDNMYEVDMIYESRVINNQMHYLVKWKNFDTDANTWEPISHLSECQDLLKYYHFLAQRNSQIDADIIIHFFNDLTTRQPYDSLTMVKLCAFLYGEQESVIRSRQPSVIDLQRKIETMSFESLMLKDYNTLVYLMEYSEIRKVVLTNINEWETKINDSLPEGTPKIKVENNFDLEMAPNDFHYINDYLNRTTIKKKMPAKFCKCRDCFKGRRRCCPINFDTKFPYNEYKCLILDPGLVIYECNERCQCSSNCANRVVQNGSKVQLAIFRTENDTGWGLKTLEIIKKGQFIIEYFGEVISSRVAVTRSKKYNCNNSYLFDADCSVTIDAKDYGNMSRFINHSLWIPPFNISLEDLVIN